MGKQSRSVFVDDENNNLGWGTFQQSDIINDLNTSLFILLLQ